MRGQKFLITMNVITILFLLFNIFVLNILQNDVIAIATLIVYLGILIFVQGFEKDKSEHLVDSGITIISYCIAYFVFIYMFGIVTGYAKTIYNHEFLSIIKNIVPVILIIFLQELIRYQVVSKAKGGRHQKLVLATLVIALILFDIRSALPLSKEYREILDTFSITIFPAMAKNGVFTYLTYLIGYKPVILYRLLVEMPIFVVPIYPDLGPYLTGIIDIAFPFLMCLVVRNLVVKQKKFFIREKKTMRRLLGVPVSIVLLMSIMLVSGYFKYYALGIVSNSMYPEIARGDIVVVKKLNNQEKQDIKLGQVIVYQREGRVIVHRLVDVSKLNGKNVYTTKGDNNQTSDNYTFTDEDIIGVATYKVPMIGYPSVWLSEMG